jgi:indole-3-glycerol phosphate synthase
MTPADGPDLLSAIVAATRRSLDTRAGGTRAGAVRAPAPSRQPDGRGFVERLSRPSTLNVIAECKRRSPSRGVLRADYDPASIAAAYASAGAAAISVLTEPAFFDGSLDHLRAVRDRVTVPVLRKDFVIDPSQLADAVACGADAVLLIVAALDAGTLAALHREATAMGLAALVEVHDRSELAVALDAGPRVIGVNNRNLRTLQVDSASCLDLVGEIPDEIVAVAESGLRSHADLIRLRDAGYDAFLVGERLVTEDDPGRALCELLRCS